MTGSLKVRRVCFQGGDDNLFSSVDGSSVVFTLGKSLNYAFDQYTFLYVWYNSIEK